MELVVAGENDSEKILEFFSKTTLPGDVEIRLRRMYNFFNYYRVQTDDFVTYLLLNEDKQIEAMASLLFHKAYIEGKEQSICYATDLRVSGNRKAIMHWSQHFLPVIEREREKRNCQFVFSSVASSQRQAYNALIRPRSLKRRIPRYHLFRKLQLVSIHGLWPIHSKALPGIKMQKGTASELPQIANYLIQRYSERPMHGIGKTEDFMRVFNQWKGLRADDFIIARDHRGEIIGCCALWSSRNVQRYFASSYSPSGDNFRSSLFWLSLFSNVHKIPPKNSELLPRFMCFLQVDNPDVHESLVHYAFQDIGKDEFLVYPHFEGDLHTLPPRGFINSVQRYGFFCLLAPNEALPNFLKPTLFSPGPAFEAVWV